MMAGTNFKRLIPTILLSILSFGSKSQTEIISSATLIFTAIGFSQNNGNAVIFLYRKDDAVPKSPFKKLSSNIENRKAEIKFEDMPYGEYAAILLHDKNSNGEIDHLLGIPSEPLGYTNDWRLSFFSGMPSFEKLKFSFNRSHLNQTISISYKK